VRVLRGGPQDWDDAPGTAAVALGVFDGVHLGHRAVIAEAVNRPGLVPAVLTFGTHPAALLSPAGPPPMLTTLERRLELIEALGVAVAAVIDFDEQLRALPPDAFIASYLLDGLEARHVVAGEDFRFGNQAAGTVAMLQEVGQRRGFGVTAVGAVSSGAHEVRSTTIRSLLASGEVAEAAAFLGRPHELPGRVVRGDGRGRTIGVPTANLDIPEGLAVPGSGVYVVTVTSPAGSAAGVANIGVRPTFEGTVPIVEVHLLDFEGDLYGKALTVGFVERIRDERRFDSADALVGQIRDDIAIARVRLRRTP